MGMSKHTAIPMRVKKRVWWRDNGLCIICHQPGNPEAHVVSRAQGGRGIEQNIVTLCRRCHSDYDGARRIEDYLKERYENWQREDMIYHKWPRLSGTDRSGSSTLQD